MNPRLHNFSGGGHGIWKVRSISAVTGETLPACTRLSAFQGESSGPSVWTLRGVTSNERYVEAEDKASLLARQEGLGRAGATCAALIPIRKNAEWWGMTQDARKELFDVKSRHTAIGLDYLPAIARRLHHCRDLSTAEPFDFLTWFEYSPEHEPAFDELLARLRATDEWNFVEREVDIRLDLAE